MRILITNDDGISAPGLLVLEAIATELAGPDGEVWVVAPAFEQSGVGHCISYTKPLMMSELAPRRVAVEGSPADCVLAALHHVMKDTPPDLILSGVNRGNNSAENTLYSGTLGGAMEGALQGKRAIALSQYMGPETAKLDNPFEAAQVHGAALIRKVLAHMPASQEDGYRTFFNINFPPVAAPDVKGARVVPQGKRPNTVFGVEPFASPSGRQYMWIKGGNQHGETPDGTDVRANSDGYISVTPMRADLTAHDLIAGMKDIE